MSRAVRFERYGGVEVLEVVDVEPPQPAEGQVLVRVRAAGINPFESKLRRGLLRDQIKLSFPAAQGTDVSGIVEQVGPGVDEVAVGAEVFGSAVRGSHAELARIPHARLLPLPTGLSWEVAGGLWTVATTASAAVGAVDLGPQDVVVVAGAAGGVGGLAAQLARHRGASVVGVAGERSHPWLRSRGIIPVTYGDGLEERLRQLAPAGARLGALVDTVGGGYVELGIRLGIDPGRINTIVDFDAAASNGAMSVGGQAAGSSEVAEVARLLAAGELELPIAATFALEQVQEAYTLLEQGHPAGKIVLIP